jgi:hypothetical protein
MTTISEQYMNELHKQFQFFATWTPDTPLNIGDIGQLKNNQFTYLSSLENEKIPFSVRKDPSKSGLNYTSSSNIKITTKLTGDAGIPSLKLSVADAGMTVEFGSQKGIVFQADGVEHQMINDVNKLDQAIKKKYSAKDWAEDWVVISDLMVADSGTVLISRGKNAAISLKAKANVPNLSLANINANFDVAYQAGMNTNIVCKSGLTPLFKLRGISKSIFSGTIVGPKAGIVVGDKAIGKGSARSTASKPVTLISVKEIDYEPFL